MTQTISCAILIVSPIKYSLSKGGLSVSQCKYTPKPRQLSMAELNFSKTLNLRLEDHLRSLAVETGSPIMHSQADRVHYCATFWQGYWCPKCKKYHYMHTTGCKHKLCPICATRSSRVTAIQAVEAIEYMHQHTEGLELDLLTLTVKNVPGGELAATVDKILKGWRRLANDRHVRGLHGWAKTVEIVPGINQDGTYHPHVHVLIVHKGLQLMGLGWWIQAWKKAMELDYDPVCDLRPVEDTVGAVYEVSKYVSKLTRVFDGTALEHDHVRYLCQAIYNRRLRTYGGQWVKARRELNMLEAEKLDDDAISEYGEMTSVSEKCPHCGTAIQFATLRWAGLSYATTPDEIRVISFPS